MRFLSVLCAIACAVVSGANWYDQRFAALWFLVLAIGNTFIAIKQQVGHAERA